MHDPIFWLTASTCVYELLRSVVAAERPVVLSDLVQPVQFVTVSKTVLQM